MENPIYEIAYKAFGYFAEGWATGDFTNYLDMITDDFTFWFPNGKHGGEFYGREGHEHMVGKCRDHTAANERLTLYPPHSVTCNETTVMYEFRTEGYLNDKFYQGRTAIAFDVRVLISSGSTALEQEIVIVNPETSLACGADTIGEIWVSGQNIAKGYWNNPEKTSETFEAYIKDSQAGPFLRTGDLGFLKDGELFVTGRIKDLIIIRGRNFYPQDIEKSVENLHFTLTEIRQGCICAFSSEQSGAEKLGIILEINPDKNPEHTPEKIFAEIRKTVFNEHQVNVAAIVLLKPGNVPKTSSGKVMRFACRNAFLNGFSDPAYTVVAQSVI